MGLDCQKQVAIDVFYDGQQVGHYVADIVVNKCVIVELKAVEELMEAHEAQLTNYLRATNIEVGLLFNFGKEAEFKRKAFSNKYKQHEKVKDQNYQGLIL